MRKYFYLLFPVFLSLVSCGQQEGEKKGKVPVIMITDLYFPGVDVDDNIDILVPFAMDGIDLKGVVYDMTQEHRNSLFCNFTDDAEYSNSICRSRDPGFIPIAQLNYIYDKQVPSGCSPFRHMTSPEDKVEDVPAFQEQGIDLMLDILEKAQEPVHIVTTGSLRPVAIAYNRRPDLMCSDKVAAIHVAAGASNDANAYVEWNIMLDTLAAARVFRSPMKLALYPCATEKNAMDLGENNAFWMLRNSDFVLDMDPMLRNFLAFNMLSVSDRPDYLNYLEQDLPEREVNAMKMFQQKGMWTTSIWQQILGLKLVKHPDGSCDLSANPSSDDVIYEEGLRDVTLQVNDNGTFNFAYSDQPTGKKIYFRKDAKLNEDMLNDAFPRWYKTFCGKQH